MPNKTIYVSDEDLPLYEHAQQLAGGNLSAAVSRALALFVEAQEGRHAGYEEVTVRVGSGRARRVQRFSGVLIGEWRHPTGEHRIERFRVYRTRKGHFALHVTKMPDWASWSDPDTWRGRWDWDFDMAGLGERLRDRKRAKLELATHLAPHVHSWWWGPAEESLEVVDSLDQLQDLVP
ncbi:MAG: EXLDI protein, partial [Acidimicrobiales bacterium]